MIMATPFTHLLATAACLATVCTIVAVYRDARADETGAVAHAPEELAQWHSRVNDTSGPCADSGWRSALTATGPKDSALRETQGAAGVRDVAEGGCDHSADSLGVPTDDRKPARDPVAIQGGSPEIAR